jgi:hypothetical protein
MRSIAVYEAEQRYRNKTPLVRISGEAHGELIKYSNWTGMSVKDIISNLVMNYIENYCSDKIVLPKDNTSKK